METEDEMTDLANLFNTTNIAFLTEEQASEYVHTLHRSLEYISEIIPDDATRAAELQWRSAKIIECLETFESEKDTEYLRCAMMYLSEIPYPGTEDIMEE